MREIGRCMYATLLLIILTIAGRNALAAANVLSERPNCGDYSILSSSDVRAMLEQHCGTVNPSDHTALIRAIAQLNPSAEAHAAAQRGDFRLAVLVGSIAPTSDRGHIWVVRGVDCRSLDDTDVVIWLRMNDVYHSLNQSTFEYQMRKFSIAYNQALLDEPGYPASRECTELKFSTEENYNGLLPNNFTIQMGPNNHYL
jgi:hypothetical protein